jgi:hypothetical protein
LRIDILPSNRYQIASLILFPVGLSFLYPHLTILGKQFKIQLMAVEEEINTNLRGKARIAGLVTPDVIIKGKYAPGL